MCGKIGHKAADCWENEKNASKRPKGWKSSLERSNVHVDEPGGTEFIVTAVQMKREFGLIEQETPNLEKNNQGGGQSEENCDLKLINHNYFNQFDTQSFDQQQVSKKQKYNFNWVDQNLFWHKEEPFYTKGFGLDDKKLISDTNLAKSTTNTITSVKSEEIVSEIPRSTPLIEKYFFGSDTSLLMETCANAIDYYGPRTDEVKLIDTKLANKQGKSQEDSLYEDLEKEQLRGRIKFLENLLKEKESRLNELKYYTEYI